MSMRGIQYFSKKKKKKQNLLRWVVNNKGHLLMAVKSVVNFSVDINLTSWVLSWGTLHSGYPSLTKKQGHPTTVAS